MVNIDPEHLRRHAEKHDETHRRLKMLADKPSKNAALWPTFLGTFAFVLITIVLFVNWGQIRQWFKSETTSQITLNTHGTVKAAVSSYRISEQAGREAKKRQNNIPTQGSAKGVNAVFRVNKNLVKPVQAQGNGLTSAIKTTNELSTGQFLTRLPQDSPLSLQKSILATYYLGEKTVDISSTIQTDSQILSQISNALSVDIFQYLNQANNRADALDEYIHLLTRLQEKTRQRINDLQTKISFLSANFQAREQRIEQSEEAFFNNLSIFNGPNAEQKLAEFVGLQQGSSEIRAKIGAYAGLRDYYQFFLPRIDNLLNTIKANRDPLIAGVKVVEVQNMSLPLIIEQR